MGVCDHVEGVWDSCLPLGGQLCTGGQWDTFEVTVNVLRVTLNSKGTGQIIHSPGCGTTRH